MGPPLRRLEDHAEFIPPNNPFPDIPVAAGRDGFVEALNITIDISAIASQGKTEVITP